MKFFKVLDIFNEINYPVDIIHENLADSYLKMGEIDKSIEFNEKSYEFLIK